MQNKYSKKQIEELYNCEIFKDSDLGLWVAQAVQFTDDEEDCFFVQATGHDVDELHENIRNKIRNHAYFKGYNEAIDDVMKKAKEIQKEQIKNIEQSPMRSGKRWAIYMNTYLGNVQVACKRLIAERLKEK